VSLGPSDPAEIPTSRRWSELADRAFGVFGTGLGERRENSELVLLAPSAWRSPQFDAVKQELVRVVEDDRGRGIPVVLPHTPETADGLPLLERAQGSPPPGIFGSLRLRDGRLVVEPISLVTPGEIVNLTLDGSRLANVASRPVIEEDEEDDPGEETDEVGHSAGAIGLTLTAIESEIESMAEGGLAAYRGAPDLDRLRARAEALGLSTCSGPLARLLESLGHLRGGTGESGAAAQTILRAHYVVRLASDAESIAQAVAGLG
jgi:hypothetical protein